MNENFVRTQHIHTHNYKTLLREIKEELNKGKGCHVYELEKFLLLACWFFRN